MRFQFIVWGYVFLRFFVLGNIDHVSEVLEYGETLYLGEQPMFASSQGPFLLEQQKSFVGFDVDCAIKSNFTIAVWVISSDERLDIASMKVQPDLCNAPPTPTDNLQYQV